MSKSGVGKPRFKKKTGCRRTYGQTRTDVVSIVLSNVVINVIVSDVVVSVIVADVVVGVAVTDVIAGVVFIISVVDIGGGSGGVEMMAVAVALAVVRRRW